MSYFSTLLFFFLRLELDYFSLYSCLYSNTYINLGKTRSLKQKQLFMQFEDDFGETWGLASGVLVF